MSSADEAVAAATSAGDAAAATAKKKQVVFMVGTSHGAKDGDRRGVSPERAKSLVDRGLARYPANRR